MDWDMKEALEYYRRQGAPGDQSALIGLLREIQREHGGGIPRYRLAEVADGYCVKEALLLAIVKRIPSLRLADTHLLELCAGPNCGKHRALAAEAERIAAASGGKITLKFGPCMRMCGKGPNLRWDGKTYNGATAGLLQTLTKEL